MGTTKKTPAICPELKPVLDQLHAEGFDVYTYDSSSSPDEITSLFWYENGRVMNIHPTHWRNSRYARDLFSLGVSYKPTTTNGSGCGLSPEDTMGTPAAELLKYRTLPTWVRGVANYDNIEQKIKDSRPLNFWKIEIEKE